MRKSSTILSPKEALIKPQTEQKHDQKKNNSQQCKRQIISFDSSYSKNVTTKVGKFFLSLIDKHSPPDHKLHKLFNRKNVKISYTCLPNIKSRINSSNRKILYPSPTIGRRTCNSINISQCPLQQKCLSNNIFYQANVTPIGENSQTKFCYGICEAKFKLR